MIRKSLGATATSQASSVTTRHKASVITQPIPMSKDIYTVVYWMAVKPLKHVITTLRRKKEDLQTNKSIVLFPSFDSVGNEVGTDEGFHVLLEEGGTLGIGLEIERFDELHSVLRLFVGIVGTKHDVVDAQFLLRHLIDNRIEHTTGGDTDVVLQVILDGLLRAGVAGDP